MEYQRKILAMFASGKEVGCGDVEGGVWGCGGWGVGVWRVGWVRVWRMGWGEVWRMVYEGVEGMVGV